MKYKHKSVPMNAYFERSILDAEPVELTRLIFQRGLTSICEARKHLRDGLIEERVRAVSRAYEALDELQASLRPDVAPELARRMGSLYDYIQTQLIEANFRQADQPLALAESLLGTLADAWGGVIRETNRRTAIPVSSDIRLAMSA